MEEEARPPLLPVRVPMNGEDLAPAAVACGGRAEIDTSAPFESVREAVDRSASAAAPPGAPTSSTASSRTTRNRTSVWELKMSNASIWPSRPRR